MTLHNNFYCVTNLYFFKNGITYLTLILGQQNRAEKVQHLEEGRGARVPENSVSLVLTKPKRVIYSTPIDDCDIKETLVIILMMQLTS